MCFEKSIFKQAGMPFNVNSPKQLGEVLFAVLKIIENPKKQKLVNIDWRILSELAWSTKL